MSTITSSIEVNSSSIIFLKQDSRADPNSNNGIYNRGWQVANTADPNRLIFSSGQDESIITYGYTSSEGFGQVVFTGGGATQIYSINTSSFTGTHSCCSSIHIDDSYFGLILEIIEDEYINRKGEIGLSMDESLPQVQICCTEKSKRIIGVLHMVETYTNEGKEYSLKNSRLSEFTYIKYTNEHRLQINSLGEGAIWVCNKYDSFDIGDLIISSSIPGYGAKQDDDIFRNYTVAKITCVCDFNLNQINKKKIVTKTINGSNSIIYKENGHVLTENIKDNSGNDIYDYRFQTRFVKENGDQITEIEYNEKLKKNEVVYIACLVGCIYYCG